MGEVINIKTTLYRTLEHKHRNSEQTHGIRVNGNNNNHLKVRIEVITLTCKFTDVEL